MSTALVSQFDDMTIIHEPESDQLHLLSSSVTSVLNLMGHKKSSKSEVLQLISGHCLDSSTMDEPGENSEAYLQHLVDQGIIKKTQ
ncbi:hypothetical protein [Neptunomonas sp.]|uniref:hypothetical protein n=1 Tax=Neptunomonas sp. TaxID=1971898 RepID=UPI0035632269